MVVDKISFQDLNFLLKILIVSLASDGCFPQSDKLTSLVFEKCSVKYPSLNNHTVSFLLSKKKKYSFMNQVLSSVHNQIITQMLFLKNKKLAVFHSVQKCFMCPSHFITEYLKDLYELCLFCLLCFVYYDY